MDVETLLPLLLKGNRSADMIKVLTAIRNGDKAKAIEAIAGDNKNPELMKMISDATKKPPAAGLGPIEGFASNEILGIFVRYYAK